MNEINIYKNTTVKNEFNSNVYWIRIGLLAIIMFSLALITIVGNTIVIYALRTDRHLRTIML